MLSFPQRQEYLKGRRRTVTRIFSLFAPTLLVEEVRVRPAAGPCRGVVEPVLASESDTRNADAEPPEPGRGMLLRSRVRGEGRGGGIAECSEHQVCALQPAEGADSRRRGACHAEQGHPICTDIPPANLVHWRLETASGSHGRSLSDERMFLLCTSNPDVKAVERHTHPQASNLTCSSHQNALLRCANLQLVANQFIRAHVFAVQFMHPGPTAEKRSNNPQCGLLERYTEAIHRSRQAS